MYGKSPSVSSVEQFLLAGSRRKKIFFDIFNIQILNCNNLNNYASIRILFKKIHIGECKCSNT